MAADIDTTPNGQLSWTTGPIDATQEWALKKKRGVFKMPCTRQGVMLLEPRPEDLSATITLKLTKTTRWIFHLSASPDGSGYGKKSISNNTILHKYRKCIYISIYIYLGSLKIQLRTLCYHEYMQKFLIN